MIVANLNYLKWNKKSNFCRWWWLSEFISYLVKPTHFRVQHFSEKWLSYPKLGEWMLIVVNALLAYFTIKHKVWLLYIKCSNVHIQDTFLQATIFHIWCISIFLSRISLRSKSTFFNVSIKKEHNPKRIVSSMEPNVK